MEPCTLKKEAGSTLVEEDLQVGESSTWVEGWPSDCAIEAGTTIRIPYDPAVLARLLKGRASQADETPPKKTKKPRKRKKQAKVVEEPVTVAEAPALVEVPEPVVQGVEAMQKQESPQTTIETVGQPTPPVNLVNDLGALAKNTGGDPTLTRVLAVVAVLGGGTAWKFYRQFSEQKHEERMEKMKLDAKSQGNKGESPGACQAVHAQLKAEMEEVKGRLSKMDNKLALNADFDGDALERKVKKLEKWRKSVEEEEDV